MNGQAKVNGFPADEKFGLISQIRRAVASVPSNIAEGQARRSTAEFIQFLSIVEGSLVELETQLFVSVELNFAANGKVTELLGSIHQLQKMLYARRSKLATRHTNH
jgi:four helix bundle protein